MLELMHIARGQLNQFGYADSEYKVELIEKGHQLFRRARIQGRLGQWWATVTGRSRALLALAAVEAEQTIVGRHEGGIQVVALDQIRGSQGRSRDFDRDFNPLQEHTEQRWISVALAWLRGATLPPVELVQVGEIYYVVDGHHRVAVARALGLNYIDAEVTVWEVHRALRSESLPVPACCPGCQPA